jgi:cytoskeletal protein RodZ
MAAIATIVVVLGAGAFVAQAMRPADVTAANPTAAPIVSAPVVVVSTDPVATAATTAQATTPTATAPGATQRPAPTAPPQTPAPTAPPVSQNVVYSSRLANGTTVTYSGPNSVVQGTALDGILSVRVAAGGPGSEPLTLYVGLLGSAQSVTLSPDINGNYRFSLRVTSAKGAVPMNFSLGKNGSIQTLGTITVR